MPSGVEKQDSVGQGIASTKIVEEPSIKLACLLERLLDRRNPFVMQGCAHMAGILPSDWKVVNQTLGPYRAAWYNPIPMSSESSHGFSAYRVTLFFGPEPVEGVSGIQACVFNVKKRSWKAGIQVSVELTHGQLSHLLHELRITDRVAEALMACSPEARAAYQARVPDLFAQAVAWCKLDLCMAAGLTQEHQRIPAAEFVSELDRSVVDRTQYVATYILSELDVAPDYPSP